MPIWAYVLIVAVIVIISCLFLVVMEKLELRKWNKMLCPICNNRYNVKNYHDVLHWQVERFNDSGEGGFFLNCQHCGKETKFTKKGLPVNGNSLQKEK